MTSVSATDAIRRRKLYQDVMDRILRFIQSEGYKAGDQLPSERELMERYGVGRPAVREALQNLEWMGIVSIHHGERARLAMPSFDALMWRLSPAASRILRTSEHRLEELKEARLVFEVQMARMAAAGSGPAEVKKLHERLDAQRACQAGGDVFLDLDLAFHREISVITGNSIFAAVSEAMMRWLAEFHRELVRVPGAEQLTVKEHEAIVDAIEVGDADASETAMRAHLTRANELYRKLREAP